MNRYDKARLVVQQHKDGIPSRRDDPTAHKGTYRDNIAIMWDAFLWYIEILDDIIDTVTDIIDTIFGDFS